MSDDRPMPKIVSASPVATWFEPRVSARTANSIEDSAPANAAGATPTHDAAVAEVGAEIEGDGEGGDGADQHHALDAEVDDAALLHDELARRREQDRGRDADRP